MSAFCFLNLYFDQYPLYELTSTIPTAPPPYTPLQPKYRPFPWNWFLYLFSVHPRTYTDMMQSVAAMTSPIVNKTSITTAPRHTLTKFRATLFNDEIIVWSGGVQIINLTWFFYDQCHWMKLTDCTITNLLGKSDIQLDLI